MVVQWRIYSQAKYLHLSVTTDEFEREEKYKNVDEEEDEDGSKSALIDQVFNHRQVYKDSCGKNKKSLKKYFTTR